MNSASHYLNLAWNSFFHLTLRYFRRLTKETVIFLPVIILIFLLFNLLAKPTLFEATKARAAKNPHDLQAKLVLGKLLYQNHNLPSAEIELQKVVASPKADAQTHEAASLLLKKISLEKNHPGKIREEVAYWQKQNTLHPNSRDINLKLAFLNWKLYRIFEATKHLNIAVGLDPNNVVLKKLSLALR